MSNGQRTGRALSFLMACQHMKDHFVP